MNLEILSYCLGPLQNNVYILGDQDNGDAVLIDPGFGSESLLAPLKAKGWTLQQIWLTHAHFDHMAGVGVVAHAFLPPVEVGLHPADLEWYHQDGGAGQFGFSIPGLSHPQIQFEDGMILGLGKNREPVVKVLHAPGHSPGHVMFYCERLGTLWCGDVIFRCGVGRTDLLGGDQDTLIKSIRKKVLSLPDTTRLLPGHGPESTVGYERAHNPFLL